MNFIRKFSAVLLLVTMIFSINLSIRTYAATYLTSMPMFKYKYLAHAMGRYKGHNYTNTIAAFNNSKKKGFHFYEIDLALTKDGKVVLTHGFSEESLAYQGIKYNSKYPVLTQAQFLSKKVFGRWKTVALKTIYTKMKENKKFYFEFDIHASTDQEISAIASQIVETFKNDTAVLNRCLIQVQSEHMYDIIDNIYHFKCYQFNATPSVYNGQTDYLINYCTEHKIGAVAINYKYASKKIVQKFKKAGIRVLAYTVDNKKIAKKLFNYGVDTICTNKLY